MRTVVLCGGRGTRLDELGKAVPKALVEIGGYPILWHLMNLYASSGFNDFTLCTGHLGDLIKNYFDRSNENEGTDTSPFSRSSVKIFDTGLDTNTGGRIAKIKDDLESEERFFVTYGDGLSDVDINALLAFHLSHGKKATLTSVRPTSTFGLLDISDEGEVRRFAEKPKLDIWINGGFFVFERSFLDYLDEDSVLEREPLEKLADEGELMAFRHDGFWKCMDTFKDNLEFNELWRSSAPWKRW